MKRIYLLSFLMFAAMTAMVGQTTVLDFETPGTSTTFQYFGSSLDGSLTSIVGNPNPSGINDSDSVTVFLKPMDSQVWAGAFSNPNPTIPVDVTSGGQVCIDVHMDHIGNLALKLENSSTGGANWVTTQSNTVTGDWETLCYDVTLPSEEDPFGPAAGHVFNTITLFFDFQMAVETKRTYYFDNIVVAPAATVCDAVLDFETDSTSTVFQIFGSTLDGTFTGIDANPETGGINPSDSVGTYWKPANSQVWAGCFSNPNPQIPVDLTNGTQVCIKMKTDHVGNLALKLENSTSGGANWINQLDYTDVDQWQELCFDVSTPSIEDPFQPAAGHIFSTVTLFFDFGISDTVDHHYYFDDICVVQGGGATSADVDFAVDMNTYQSTFKTVYVSGTFNNWSGDANPMDDSDGDGIWTTTINIPTGSHEYKFTLDNWAAQEEFSGTEDCTITDPSGQFVNRSLVVSSMGAETDSVCWNSCYACGEAVLITYNLGTSHITVDSAGMYIAGGGNFGVPGDFPLTETTTNVWSITFEKPVGFASYYTFTNGNCPDFSCKEDISGQACANPDNFDDRYVPPVMSDTTINSCFALCTDDTKCGTSSTRDVVAHDMLTVRPTATSDQVLLLMSTTAGEKRTIQLVDLSGKVLHTEKVPGSLDQHVLDLRMIPAGMYLVHLRSGDRIATQRVMKL